MSDFPVFSALQGKAAAADDVEMIRGDERVALEIQASPVLDSEGNVELAVVAIQDITRRKQAEAELAEYRKHLEQLVEKRTEELSAINEQLSIEASERKVLELSLQQRIAWLSAVNKAHQTIAGVTGLTLKYQDLSAEILKLLGAALVFIVRWDEHSEECDIYCSSQNGGISPDIAIVKDSLAKTQPCAREIESGKTILWSTDQAASLPVSLAECFQECGIQAAVLAPMMVRRTKMGILGVAESLPVPARSPQEIDLIERMALDLADLTQDAVLLDRALALATLEERNRLARDLHELGDAGALLSHPAGGGAAASLAARSRARLRAAGAVTAVNPRCAGRNAHDAARAAPIGCDQYPPERPAGTAGRGRHQPVGVAVPVRDRANPCLAGRCTRQFLSHRPGSLEQRGQARPGRAGRIELERSPARSTPGWSNEVRSEAGYPGRWRGLLGRSKAVGPAGGKHHAGASRSHRGAFNPGKPAGAWDTSDSDLDQ